MPPPSPMTVATLDDREAGGKAWRDTTGCTLPHLMGRVYDASGEEVGY